MTEAPHVLVVDDDLAVAQTFNRILTVNGYRVSVVHSTQAALELSEREAPDAILLDFRMPLASGLSFLQELRRQPTLSELPVAIVTGDHFLNEQTLQEIRALGATVRYKPLYMDDLVALVRSLVRRPTAER